MIGYNEKDDFWCTPSCTIFFKPSTSTETGKTEKNRKFENLSDLPQGFLKVSHFGCPNWYFHDYFKTNTNRSLIFGTIPPLSSPLSSKTILSETYNNKMSQNWAPRPQNWQKSKMAARPRYGLANFFYVSPRIKILVAIL